MPPLNVRSVDRTDDSAEAVMHHRRRDAKLLTGEATADEVARHRLCGELVRVLVLMTLLPVAGVMFTGCGLRRLIADGASPRALRVVIPGPAA